MGEHIEYPNHGGLIEAMSNLGLNRRPTGLSCKFEPDSAEWHEVS